MPQMNKDDLDALAKMQDGPPHYDQLVNLDATLSASRTLGAQHAKMRFFGDVKRDTVLRTATAVRDAAHKELHFCRKRNPLTEVDEDTFVHRFINRYWYWVQEKAEVHS